MIRTRYEKDHISKELYEHFFATAEISGWENAIQSIESKMSPKKAHKIRKFLSDKKRNDFIYLLDINPDSTAVDVGSGWGNTSYTLSSVCKQIFSIEADEDRLLFSARHLRHKGACNVVPIRGSADALPLKDDSADIVIFNGVLEWTPEFIGGHPRAVHDKVLGEARRVLRDGGQIAISIENRFGYEYLIGKKDFHCGGARFITFLPRFVADLYSRILLGKPYRAWLYSYNGIKSLLADNGYEVERIYTYYPNHVTYRHMFDIGGTEHERVVNSILSQETMPRLRRLLMSLGIKLGIFKHLAQEFFIIARKRATT